MGELKPITASELIAPIVLRTRRPVQYVDTTQKSTFDKLDAVFDTPDSDMYFLLARCRRAAVTIAALEAENKRLMAFAEWAIQNGPFDGCELDGGEVQAKALELGILCLKSAETIAKCYAGENCSCREVCDSEPKRCYEIALKGGEA